MNMKSIFFFILCFSMYTVVSGQKVRNKQFSLFDYNLDVSKEIVEELSSLEPFIESIETFNDPGNEKLKAILIHTIYYTLKDKLGQELEMEILPTNTFLRNIKYDDYGYPNTNARTALRKGYSKYFFEVNASIESITEDKRNDNPEMFEDIDYPVVFPKISIEITIYNNEGIIPVDKWIGASEARYPLPINNYLLKGFDNTEMEVKPLDENQDDNLYLILDRAIHNTIQYYLAN